MFLVFGVCLLIGERDYSLVGSRHIRQAYTNMWECTLTISVLISTTASNGVFMFGCFDWQNLFEDFKESSPMCQVLHLDRACTMFRLIV